MVVALAGLKPGLGRIGARLAHANHPHQSAKSSGAAVVKVGTKEDRTIRQTTDIINEPASGLSRWGSEFPGEEDGLPDRTAAFFEAPPLLSGFLPTHSFHDIRGLPCRLRPFSARAVRPHHDGRRHHHHHNRHPHNGHHPASPLPLLSSPSSLLASPPRFLRPNRLAPEKIVGNCGGGGESGWRRMYEKRIRTVFPSAAGLSTFRLRLSALLLALLPLLSRPPVLLAGGLLDAPRVLPPLLDLLAQQRERPRSAACAGAWWVVVQGCHACS